MKERTARPSKGWAAVQSYNTMLLWTIRSTRKEVEQAMGDSFWPDNEYRIVRIKVREIKKGKR